MKDLKTFEGKTIRIKIIEDKQGKKRYYRSKKYKKKKNKWIRIPRKTAVRSISHLKKEGILKRKTYIVLKAKYTNKNDTSKNYDFTIVWDNYNDESVEEVSDKIKQVIQAEGYEFLEEYSNEFEIGVTTDKLPVGFRGYPERYEFIYYTVNEFLKRGYSFYQILDYYSS